MPVLIGQTGLRCNFGSRQARVQEQETDKQGIVGVFLDRGVIQTKRKRCSTHALAGGGHVVLSLS